MPVVIAHTPTAPTDAHSRPLTPTVTSLPWKFNVSDRLTDWQTDRLTDCDSHSDTNRVVLFHCINLFKGYRLCRRPICLLWAVVSWQLTRFLAGWPGLDSTGVYCIVLYWIVLYCIVMYCIVLYCIVLSVLLWNEMESGVMTCFNFCEWIRINEQWTPWTKLQYLIIVVNNCSVHASSNCGKMMKIWYVFVLCQCLCLDFGNTASQQTILSWSDHVSNALALWRSTSWHT